MASTLVPLLGKELAAHQVPLLLSTRAGDGCELARRALAEGFERIIVAGGDGSISQVVNGIAPHFARAEIAILPLGTGNDLARSLGVPLDNMAAALHLALEGPVHWIDLIRVVSPTPWYCVNAATGGIGAKVATDLDARDKARWGAFAYWVTAVTKLVELKEYQVRLELDGCVHDMPMYGLVVANGHFVGGGFPIAPVGEMDDGWLDVVAIPILPTLELLAAGLNFTFGRHYADRIQSFRAHRVHITTSPEMLFSVDGEPTAAIDTEFEVEPSALPVVIGPTPPALAKP